MGILTPKAVFPLKSYQLPQQVSQSNYHAIVKINCAVNSLKFLFSKGKLRKEKATSKQNNCKMDINYC